MCSHYTTPADWASLEANRAQKGQRARRTGPSALPVVGEPIGANRFSLRVPVPAPPTPRLLRSTKRVVGKVANSDNRNVDPIVLVIVLAVGMPLAVIWALSKSASLRGPAPRRPESRKPVGALVTDVIPEDVPEDDEDSERDGR